MPKVGQEQKISARPLLTHISRLIVAVPESSESTPPVVRAWACIKIGNVKEYPTMHYF